MRTVLTAILVAALSVALCAQSAPARRTAGWEGIAIVVDRNNPVNNVSLAELREMLFGDRQWWRHNRPVTLVTMARGSPERETVLRAIYQMDEKAFEKYFFFEVYRGEMSNGPTRLTTARDVKKFVSRKPGALGYLRASDVDSSVKVLRVEGLSPEDDGYPLRLRVRNTK